MPTTVRAGDLRIALSALKRFAAHEFDVPHLHAIRLEADTTSLVAVASDRYIAGHLRIDANGDPLPVSVVPLAYAKTAAKLLDKLSSVDPVTLEQIADEGGDLCLAMKAGELAVRMPLITSQYPDIVKLFANADGPADETVSPFALYPRSLKAFAKAHELIDPTAHVRWTVLGPNRPVRIEIGHTFVGMAMPQRLASDWPDSPARIGVTSPAEASATPADPQAAREPHIADPALLDRHGHPVPACDGDIADGRRCPLHNPS